MRPLGRAGTASVKDGLGASTSQSFTWNVTVLSLTNPGTQSTVVNTAITPLQIVASGLPTGDIWAFSATDLPPGLTISATTGVISGTVTGPITTYSVTITANDGDGASASVTFKFKVT